jgi:ATPase subunit of ABC transporter with duplicated ATPase domains
VLAETMAGAGEVSALAGELAELEAAMADPERMDELDRLVARFGDVQPRFDELGGYELEPRARRILAGLGFADDVVQGDVGALSGGWKMRVALARRGPPCGGGRYTVLAMVRRATKTRIPWVKELEVRLAG